MTIEGAPAVYSPQNPESNGTTTIKDKPFHILCIYHYMCPHLFIYKYMVAPRGLFIYDSYYPLCYVRIYVRSNGNRMFRPFLFIFIPAACKAVQGDKNVDGDSIVYFHRSSDN